MQSINETSKLQVLRDVISGARRGLIVAGELCCQEEVAAVAALSQALRWPTVADVLSGLRVGGAVHPQPQTLCRLDEDLPDSLVLHHMDQVLADPEGSRGAVWETLRPDVILQVLLPPTSFSGSPFPPPARSCA